jgi:hypothetical protein
MNRYLEKLPRSTGQSFNSRVFEFIGIGYGAVSRCAIATYWREK